VLPGRAILDTTYVNFAGDIIGLSTSKPSAGNHRYAGVYLTSSGTLAVALSTAQSNGTPLDDTDIQEVIDGIAAGDLPLRAFVLDGDEADFSDDTSVDLRDLFGEIPGAGGGGSPTDYILIRDEKAQNTAGGTFSSGSWQTRDLNTEVSDAGGHASVASNQITLVAGTYRIRRIRVPAHRVGRHQARLQNITDTATIELGTSEYAPPGTDASTNHSEITGRFTLGATKVLEVQHRCSDTGSTNGFGVEANFDTEIYTIVELERES
jgi:hypothetical protein